MAKKYIEKEELLRRAECTDIYLQIKELADELPDAGVREKVKGVWIEDKTYSGKDKKIFHCSRCNHWQSSKSRATVNQMFYMNFCPFCGAEMEMQEKTVNTFGFDERVVEYAASISIKKLDRVHNGYVQALLKKWHDLDLKNYDDVVGYQKGVIK